MTPLQTEILANENILSIHLRLISPMVLRKSELHTPLGAEIDGTILANPALLREYLVVLFLWVLTK
jgi:hypothetical protein